MPRDQEEDRGVNRPGAMALFLIKDFPALTERLILVPVVSMG